MSLTTQFFVSTILSLTQTSNAEGGMGLICACLPILNVLRAYYRPTSSPSHNCYPENSHIQLGKRQSGRNSKSAARWQESLSFGDESHLISVATTPDANENESVRLENGIRKTVAVSQTVETTDSPQESQ